MERAVRMRIIKGMLAAFMTFSRIPVVGVRIDKEDMKYSMCFLPVIGIIIGLIQWLADAAFTWLGAGELMRVALMTAVPVLVTGGIHMDGFCDTTDAVSSYQTKERKLEILKDSNAGAFAVIYGVLWFVLSVLHLQWFALEGFFRQFLEGLFCHFWGFEFHKRVTWHQSKFS